MSTGFDVEGLRALVREAEADDLTLGQAHADVCAAIDAWAATPPGPPDRVRAIREELGRSSADDPEELRAQLALLEQTLAGAP